MVGPAELYRRAIGKAKKNARFRDPLVARPSLTRIEHTENGP